LTKSVKSLRSGYLSAVDAEKIGLASLSLGAGRNRKEDAIDFAAGITLSKKLGDYLNAGDNIAVLHTDNEDALDEAEKKCYRQ
jgi:Thymidine phosphorylase